MKTEKEIEANILTTTMKIQQQYPELSKYLTEMPISVPNVENPEINIKNLQDYHNSLLELLNKYIPNHNKN
jgi:hypothetical protein